MSLWANFDEKKEREREREREKHEFSVTHSN